jgi:hypothetical protein
MLLYNYCITNEHLTIILINSNVGKAIIKYPPNHHFYRRYGYHSQSWISSAKNRCLSIFGGKRSNSVWKLNPIRTFLHLARIGFNHWTAVTLLLLHDQKIEVVKQPHFHRCAKRLRRLRLQICFVSQFPMFQISSVVTTPYLTDLTGSPSIHFTLSFLGLFANKNRESFTLARKESAKKLRIWRGGMQ